VDEGFETWVGRSAANRAWDLLADTREAVLAARGEPSADDPAWLAVFAAEASDWFRWFAADSAPRFAADLDACFRGHLIRAWTESGAEPPQRLNDPIRESREDRSHAPAGPVRPTIDGRVEDWFEWLAAGRIDCAEGEIAAAEVAARSLRFGGDGAHLFLRIDPTEPGGQSGLGGALVRIVFPGWPDRTLTAVVPSSGAGETGPVRIASDRVVEIAVPVDALPGDGETYRFHVEVETADGVQQRIPDAGALSLPVGEDQERPWDWHV
jgi:hypothetical protein